MTMAGSDSAGAVQPAHSSRQRNAQPDKQGWVHYTNTDEPLLDGVIKTYRGQRDKTGGCQFSGSEELLPGSPVVLEREISYNQSSCEMRVERGRLASPSPTEPSGLASASEAAAPGESAAASGSPDFSAAAVYSSKAYLKTYYEDPAQLDVDTVRPDVAWLWDGVCTVDTSYHTTLWHWLNDTGWRLRAYDMGTYADCGVRTTGSYGHFSNSIFCLTVDTETFHDRSLVQGRADGSAFFSWNSYKRGGCNNLLSFHSEYGFEY